jgi:hypothetical protein
LGHGFCDGTLEERIFATTEFLDQFAEMSHAMALQKACEPGIE